MNENVGASFGLSVLIVLCFAVALYQPDRATGKPQASKPEKLASKSVRVSKQPPAFVATEPNRTPLSKTIRPVSQQAIEKNLKVAEGGSSGPRGAFTTARAGEKLEDVARRVYGIEGSAERLWKANRDLIDNASSKEPLRTGMLVRTP